MSNKPYRLAQGGSLIDRSRKVHFTFDGKPMTGFAGDTAASAVYQSAALSEAIGFVAHVFSPAFSLSLK